MSNSLVATARRLARADSSRPRQVDLRRAVSTAYYAMFSTLARECADRFIGSGRARHDRAWTQVYRALEHGAAKSGCAQVASYGLPRTIVKFADEFVRLQDERHRADYDPSSRFTRARCETLIREAEQAIVGLKSAPVPARKAFAALVLFKRR